MSASGITHACGWTANGTSWCVSSDHIAALVASAARSAHPNDLRDSATSPYTPPARNQSHA